jgi:hypothetical protein
VKTVGQIVEELEESLPKWIGEDPEMVGVDPDIQLEALQGAADFVRFVRLNLPHDLKVYNERLFLRTAHLLWETTIEEAWEEDGEEG